MSFEKREWVNRSSTYPNRRKLVPTGTENEYDVFRSEGVVITEGDLLDAEALNGLENRIAAAFKTAEDVHTNTSKKLTTTEQTAEAGKKSAQEANAKIDKLISDINAIKIVEALPESPDPNTLYLIPK